MVSFHFVSFVVANAFLFSKVSLSDYCSRLLESIIKFFLALFPDKLQVLIMNRPNCISNPKIKLEIFWMFLTKEKQWKR